MIQRTDKKNGKKRIRKKKQKFRGTCNFPAVTMQVENSDRGQAGWEKRSEMN